MTRTVDSASAPWRHRAGTVAELAAARGPEWATLALVALTVAAAVTVSLGVHRPWTTLPLALIVGWGLARLVRPDANPADAVTRRAGTYAMVAVGLWIVLSMVLSSEYLIVTRDPGFLSLSGWWLIDHPHTDIPALGGVQAAATQANIIPDAWEAWNLRGDVIQPQGAKGLPAVLSVAGWVAGPSGVLVANALIGGTALWALYALASRMLGPRAALVPTGLLGLNVAHQALSRSPYTEPLTMVLALAAAGWALRGVAERRTGPLLAAAVASGAVGFVRIDGAAIAVGVLAGACAAALFSRAVRPATLALVALVQAGVLALTFASLWRWSEAYLDRLSDRADALVRTYAAAVILTLVIAAGLAVWERVGPRRAATVSAARSSGRWAITAGITASVVLAGLASRPWWLTQRRGTSTQADQFTNNTVQAFQQIEGYPVDPTRTYGEHTVTWLSYYVGWPLVIVAIVGLGVLVWRAARSQPGWWAVVGTLGAPTLLYLVRPSIVPDQLWAIRRLEPTAMPLLALTAVVGAWWLVTLLGRLDIGMRPHALRTAAAAALAASVVSTWISIDLDDEYPVLPAVYLYQREQLGARDQLADLCAVADGRPIVLAGSASYFGSLRVTCDVPVVLALVTPQPEALLEMAEVWGESPLVLTRSPEWFWEVEPVPVVVSETVQGEYALQHMPRQPNTSLSYWYAGLVADDGSVTAWVAP